jgi:hypothetical protein
MPYHRKFKPVSLKEGFTVIRNECEHMVTPRFTILDYNVVILRQKYHRAGVEMGSSFPLNMHTSPGIISINGTNLHPVTDESQLNRAYNCTDNEQIYYDTPTLYAK